ncbi:glycosyltransferase family 39 protein [Flavobacteriaceae bacterium TP-CH-4]|uniref:Glycosyltransferase family 39 protein n=1 Tax=Pelagihabitans pacificus TaxID=2696054 RepID=A0A967ATM5_9FLAO|nr:glycosyltransferase family 39 protein [Pelagihabitans pacificus]NHF58768.1 glycosyltransferase family 39 protein [Pelagihabitans pacificus]
MLNRLIKTLSPNYNDLSNKGVFFVLLSIATLVRFPFYFRDYIDRDESTFILMGQSWVDGHLPYTELWDLKPPIVFLFFAGIIYVFGKSFLAIRFFGTLLVASSAFFTYRIGEAMCSKKVALWAAMAAVALQSMFGSIQGVMSEHLCMAFLMPGLYLLIRPGKWWRYLGAGLLMGLAIMTKLNIAYAVLFIGIYLLFYFFRRKEYTTGIANVAFYGLGILLVIASTWLPYYLEGKPGVWWKSVVLASMEYAGSRRSSMLNLAPTFLVLTAFFLFTWRKKYLNFKDVKIQIVSVAIFGVLFSFAKAGRINSHYLIQLHPLLIILVAIFISRLQFPKKWIHQPFLALLLLLVPAESYLEYYRIIKYKIERGTFYNGEGITVPAYLAKNYPSEKNVLFLGYHIGYWPLGAVPPTMAATHPSNICRNELFPYFDNPRKTAIEELAYIMGSVRPKIVVTRKNRLVFDEKLKAENRYIDTYLKKHYKLVSTVDLANIYQRLE